MTSQKDETSVEDEEQSHEQAEIQQQNGGDDEPVVVGGGRQPEFVSGGRRKGLKLFQYENQRVQVGEWADRGLNRIGDDIFNF